MAATAGVAPAVIDECDRRHRLQRGALHRTALHRRDQRDPGERDHSRDDGGDRLARHRRANHAPTP